MELRSSLGRARGLGSANEGVHHWWGQRVSAIALVPLGIWFVFSAVGLIGADYAAYQAWLDNFGNAILFVLFIIVLFYHAYLGMQVVIEDYVSGEAAKITALIVMKFVLALMGVSCVLSVMKVAAGS